MVLDKASRNVIEPNAVYNIKDLFNNPRPLDTPITEDEVVKNIHKLRNNRAPGCYQIPPELLKYARTELYDFIAESLNNTFAKHEYVSVGHRLLTTLWKPGKLKGPTKNLRPVILLIVLRKVISNTVLTRTQPKVKEYLSPSQSAYRHGRSTSDIVWCHRFTLDINSSSNISNPFDTNVVSPQEDGLSGFLFIIYLEKALRFLRDRADNNHVAGEHSYAVSSKVPSQMRASILMTQI